MTNEECLKSIPLFTGLQATDLAQLAARTRRRTYAPKTQILWRGEPGETLYAIVSGKVKVHSVTEAGTDVTLAVLGTGAHFGEISVIDKAPRSADVTAIEKTECVLLDSDSLREATTRIPSIAWHLLYRLAQLVREQNANVEAFASQDVTGRVATLLLRLSEQHGEPWSRPSPKSKGGAEIGVRVTVPLTKTDIKSFIGATREHVTNIMTEFTRSGYITTDTSTGHIVIMKPDDLARRTQ